MRIFSTRQQSDARAQRLSLVRKVRIPYLQTQCSCIVRTTHNAPRSAALGKMAVILAPEQSKKLFQADSMQVTGGLGLLFSVAAVALSLAARPTTILQLRLQLAGADCRALPQLLQRKTPQTMLSVRFLPEAMGEGDESRNLRQAAVFWPLADGVPSPKRHLLLSSILPRMPTHDS